MRAVKHIYKIHIRGGSTTVSKYCLYTALHSVWTHRLAAYITHIHSWLTYVQSGTYNCPSKSYALHNIYMQTTLLKWLVFHQGLHISRTERSCGILTGVEHWFWDWAALSYKTGEGGQVFGLSNSSLCLEETLVREFLGSWGQSLTDRGRDLSKWLSRRDPRVLSIQSQESSRLWTSCMHWIYPVLYLCWASASKTGSECMGKYF